MKTKVFLLGQVSTAAALLTIQLLSPLLEAHFIVGTSVAAFIGFTFAAIGWLLARKVAE